MSSELCKVLDLKVDMKKYQNKERIKMDKHHSLEESLSILRKDSGFKPIHCKMGEEVILLDKENWRDLLFKIAAHCYKKDSTIIYQMAAGGAHKFLSATQSDKNKKIADNIFITLTYSAEQIMKYVKVLLTEYGIADDFEIKLR